MGFLTSIPIIGGSFDHSADDAYNELKKNQDLYNRYQPPELKYGTYNPEAYQATTVNENPMLGQDQMQYLSKLANLSDTGLSDADKISYERASGAANDMANQREGAIEQEAASRGAGGGGLSYAMRGDAAQQAANRMHDQGLQTAADSAKMRALYTQAYGTGLGNVRQQNFNNQAANADIMNKFNQLNTSSANQGQQYNINNAFNAGNQNWQNRKDWLAGATGANTGVARGDYAQNAANTSERNNITNAATRLWGASMKNNKDEES
jgi:hypothetical protein